MDEIVNEGEELGGGGDASMSMSAPAAASASMSSQSRHGRGGSSGRRDMGRQQQQQRRQRSNKARSRDMYGRQVDTGSVYGKPSAVGTVPMCAPANVDPSDEAELERRRRSRRRAWEHRGLAVGDLDEKLARRNQHGQAVMRGYGQRLHASADEEELYALGLVGGDDEDDDV